LVAVHGLPTIHLLYKNMLNVNPEPDF